MVDVFRIASWLDGWLMWPGWMAGVGWLGLAELAGLVGYFHLFYLMLLAVMQCSTSNLSKRDLSLLHDGTNICSYQSTYPSIYLPIYPSTSDIELKIYYDEYDEYD